MTAPAQTWRDWMAPKIAETLDALPKGATLKEKRRAIRDAYPAQLGRVHWPYRVWLSEARIQLGLARRAWSSRKSQSTPPLPFPETKDRKP